MAFEEPAGKPLDSCKLVRIKLSLDSPEDLQYLRPGGGGTPALRKARLFRMAFEAVDQGARLTQEDFARLLGVDVRTIRRIIRAFRQEKVYIPTRGYSKDIGRGTSHKTIAVRMFLEYATYSAIAQKTGDVPANLQRYLKNFVAIVNALELGTPEHQLPVVTGLSAPLVAEYLALYKEYNTPEHQGMLERIRHPLPPAPQEPFDFALRPCSGQAGWRGRRCSCAGRHSAGCRCHPKYTPSRSHLSSLNSCQQTLF